MDKFFERKYAVEVSKLKPGLQEEAFHVDDSFFEAFEHSEIKGADVQVIAEIQKFERHLDVNFKIGGSLTLECDRCLEHYPHQIEANNRMIYSWDESLEFNTDDVVLLNENDNWLVIIQEIYDYISLLIPIRKVPDESVHACSPEVLAFITGESSTSDYADIEEGDEEEDGSIDPRWEALKKLKDDLNN